MLISFDPDIIWKDSYRRNNRSRTQKHILCFPNHIDNHHIVWRNKIFSRVMVFVANLSV